MRVVRIAILFLLGVALSAVPALALKVTVDFSRTFDFSTVRTVAFGEGSVLARNELNQQRIDHAIEEELLEKGLSWTEDGEPDLLILTFAGANQRARQSNVSVGIGLSRRTSRGSINVGGSRAVGSRTVVEGTLRIDLIDARTGDLVWRAECSDTIDGDGEKAEKKIRKAVERALRDFPPGQGKKK